MTPPARPRKTEITRTVDGKLHVALGLGVASRPIILILIEGGSK
jgi:hypothetical protein